jgi:DNA-binding GntR family transcriptional regulator
MADFLSRHKQTISASSKVVDSHEAILEAVIKGRKEESLLKLEEHLLEVNKRLISDRRKIVRQ